MKEPELYQDCAACEGLGTTSDGAWHSDCDGSGRVRVEAVPMDWCTTHDSKMAAKVPEVCEYWCWLMAAEFEDEFIGECVRTKVLIVEEGSVA